MLPAEAQAGLRTPLYDFHLEQGGRMTHFAGYELPLHYKPGLLSEHLKTRDSAGLFDVSHMGLIEMRPRSGVMAAGLLALEKLIPADLLTLAKGRQRYGLFTDEKGGILDDLMIANLGDYVLLVVNAARKKDDLVHLRAHLATQCEFLEITDRALLALQGPLAEAVLAPLVPEVTAMRFMDILETKLGDERATISRSGYTGEDGFEISVAADYAKRFAEELLRSGQVQPVGLGARDSLRLEAGLCLYGQDLTVKTSPVEAALEWSIQKSRRRGGSRAGGFPGEDIILRQFEAGASTRRVGIRADGRLPPRTLAPLFLNEFEEWPIGEVTSGCFGPTLNGPVAMGYVASEFARTGQELFAEVRGKRLAVVVSDMPFAPHRYKR